MAGANRPKVRTPRTFFMAAIRSAATATWKKIRVRYSLCNASDISNCRKMQYSPKPAMNAMKGRWRRSNSRSFPCFELSGSGLPIRCSRLLRQCPRTLRIAGAQPPEYFYYSKTHESYSGKEFEPSQCKICSLKIYSFCQGQVSGSVEEDEVVCICCREPERYARRCNVFDRVEARVSLSNLEGGELLTVH